MRMARHKDFVLIVAVLVDLFSLLSSSLIADLSFTDGNLKTSAWRKSIVKIEDGRLVKCLVATTPLLRSNRTQLHLQASLTLNSKAAIFIGMSQTNDSPCIFTGNELVNLMTNNGALEQEPSETASLSVLSTCDNIQRPQCQGSVSSIQSPYTLVIDYYIDKSITAMIPGTDFHCQLPLPLEKFSPFYLGITVSSEDKFKFRSILLDKQMAVKRSRCSSSDPTRCSNSTNFDVSLNN